MTPIEIQVSTSKVSVEGQAYSLYVGEGGISVLQTFIFQILDFDMLDKIDISASLHVDFMLSMPQSTFDQLGV